MPAIVSMLRGVNLGPHKRVKMDVLRELYTGLKLKNVQTYVQSGNILFTAAEQDPIKLRVKIEKAIEKICGFQSDVFLRTTAEMRAVVAGNPFAGRPEIEPAKLVVLFLEDTPPADSLEKLQNTYKGPEEMRLQGKELYVYFSQGQGTSKLSATLLDRVLKVSATARNWNSVTKMLEMAEKLESA